MRRWCAALALALVALATLTACGGRPAGVDGNLTDDWHAPPAGQQFRPAADTCHGELTQTVAAADYAPVACTNNHVAETVSVGELTGADSMKSPADAKAQAFTECGRQADAFLGADWRTGWVVMQPVLPSKAAWAGGARWYRCDVTQTSPSDGSLVWRKTSMKGALLSGSPLRLGCANATIKDESVSAMRPVACSASHTAEFAGIWVSGSTASTSAGLSTGKVEKGCDAAIAKFAAVPDNKDIKARTGWLGFPPDDQSWSSGDHSVRCYLWLNGEKMTSSYKNAGPKKMKIHYTN
jgi:hypothetical protein